MAQKKSSRRAQRIVIKIGSRALAADPELPRRLSSEVSELCDEGHVFFIVSSGAIAIGCEKLGYRRRPKEMGRLQAAAAVGQSVLMHRYAEALALRGKVAAQVLLTHADLADRERLNNARQALGAIAEAGAVAIINENDTVATDEIRFGDNDQLASMVVPLVGATLLLLLTDVEGVLDAQGRRIRELDDRVTMGDFKAADGPGTGGMLSKVEAALKASRSGAAVLIGPATQPGVLRAMIEGDASVGTRVAPHGSALKARKHWIAYTLRPRGTVMVDHGAAVALRAGRSSLLPVGVVGVRGQFNAGDAVRLVEPSGAEIGRGLTRLGTLDLARAAGKKGRDLDVLFARSAHAGSDPIVVHKDDLVLAV